MASQWSFVVDGAGVCRNPSALLRCAAHSLHLNQHFPFLAIQLWLQRMPATSMPLAHAMSRAILAVATAYCLLKRHSASGIVRYSC